MPWILIHGANDGPARWDKFGNLLADDEIPSAAVNLGLNANPDTRAIRLAQEIDKIRKDRNWTNVKVNLVAHSQGGLDARAYLHNLGNKAKDQVYSLTMIGTPNHGSVLADFFDAFLLLVSSQQLPPPFPPPLAQRECFWLSPRWVEDFNQRTPLTPGVQYYTIAGSKCVFPRSWLIPGEDDGAVPVKSVHLDGATPLGPSSGKGTFPYEHSELVTKKDVYETIRKEIDPPYSEEPNSLAFVAIEDGEVLPGQSVSQSAIVDDVNEVAFVLISRRPLGLTLQSPSGEYITPQSRNTTISYDSSEWLDLLAQAYIVRKPVPGVWQAHVSTDTEPDHFMLVVSAENTFVFDGDTNQYFNPVGEEVRLTAALDADASILDMRANIIGPYGWREVIVLYDDGLHEDALPNDAVYGNTFLPSLEGEHTIVFSTKGIARGKGFSRADLESIYVNALPVAGQ